MKLYKRFLSFCLVLAAFSLLIVSCNNSDEDNFEQMNSVVEDQNPIAKISESDCCNYRFFSELIGEINGCCRYGISIENYGHCNLSIYLSSK